MQLPLPVDDDAWVALYPTDWHAAAQLQFTPLAQVRAASDWLSVQAGAERRRFLDLGSGTGKFCVAAAARHPDQDWEGIELRASLVAEAERWRERHGLSNLSFRQGDLTTVSLDPFAGAYLFNSLTEALDPRPDLGRDIPFGAATYRQSRAALRESLAAVRLGFRLVTYFCEASMLPTGYRQVWQGEDEQLVGWVWGE